VEKKKKTISDSGNAHEVPRPKRSTSPDENEKTTSSVQDADDSGPDHHKKKEEDIPRSHDDNHDEVALAVTPPAAMSRNQIMLPSTSASDNTTSTLKKIDRAREIQSQCLLELNRESAHTTPKDKKEGPYPRKTMGFYCPGDDTQDREQIQTRKGSTIRYRYLSR
jgi:hypothetical protein